MSSLAAARADNFFYPPGFDPSKGVGLNKLHGTHALGKRANRLQGEGVLIIRFEMPFNVWCTKCGEMIGKGVRFNAEKRHVGMYMSTKIWSFCMRHHCGSRIEIHTDPKNTEYMLVEGARRKVEGYNAADAEVLDLTTVEERAELQDPLKRLEHNEVNRKRARVEQMELASMREEKTFVCLNDAKLNRLIRGRLRHEKKEALKDDKRREELGLPSCVTLLPETDEDRLAASQVRFSSSRSCNASHANDWKSKRKAVLRQSIFDKTAVAASECVDSVVGKNSMPTSVRRKRKSILDKARTVAGLQQARPSGGVKVRVRRMRK